MLSLLPQLRKHFDSLQDRLTLFAQQGIQVEGWFKGELLLAFSRLLSNGTIERLDREVRFPEGRVDISLARGGRENLVELKHWLVGDQKGYKYDPSFYFPDPTSVGILPDVKKLVRISSSGARWLLILLTARPEADKWAKGIATFNAKFAPLRVSSHTSPPDFPPAYFLGLLSVSQATDA